MGMLALPYAAGAWQVGPQDLLPRFRDSNGGLMSDFWWSVLVAMGIIIIAMGITAWLTVRRVRNGKGRI